MNEKIKNNEISKFYLCVVHGILAEKKKTLHGYLKKNAADNMVQVREKYFDGSKEIITRYKTLSKSNGNSLLEVELVTGRTHQIRAHMAFVGNPLLGDGKYGVNREEKQRGYKYQALYAYRLCFERTESENALSYLEGKSFQLKPSDIWFLKDEKGT
jgi:23S rRNA pseudouridine955/2504/2580 synthase